MVMVFTNWELRQQHNTATQAIHASRRTRTMIQEVNLAWIETIRIGLYSVAHTAEGSVDDQVGDSTCVQ